MPTKKIQKPLKEWEGLYSFKGFNKGLSCRQFHFELGKAYSITNKKRILTCRNGFHACELPEQVNEHYAITPDNDFALVLQWGSIDRDYDKRASKHIKVLKIISYEQMIKLLQLQNTLDFIKGMSDTKINQVLSSVVMEVL